MRRTPALIVGGGPAGCAAAIALARSGLEPLLIERSEGPRDPVCGGFLGRDALAALSRLGVDHAALGARPIGTLRLIAGHRRFEAPLPWAAAGLSRRTLDEALLAAAAAAGARVVRGRAVRELDAGALKIRLDDEEEIAADALFLATGKHELRGAARDVGGRADEPAVGLRCALPLNRDLRSALENCIELHLFDRGYAGLLLQEDGSANLCLSVSRLRLAHAGGVPQLMAELAASEPALAERLAAAPDGGWSAIAGVPYGWRARSTERAVFRLGDQGAVISSLAGDGIAIALTSGELAARHLQGGGPGGANAFQSDLANRSVLPLLTADIVRKLVERAGTRRTVMRLLRHLPWIAPLVARLTRIA